MSDHVAGGDAAVAARGSGSLPPGLLGAVVAGRYRLEFRLGRGGHAVVYRAVDTSDGSRVALKRLSTVGDSVHRSRRIAQFEHEYYTLSSLCHPNIVNVRDYAVDGEGPFYTMELVDSGDLRSLSPMPWKRVAELLYEVASALAMIHARGRIHRDVTTRNVRWTPELGAKLIDFGLMVPNGVAKDLSGTPPFIAPECIQQQALDGRVDLFSLGALSYYLLTGRHAYPAKRFDQLRDYWRTPPRPIDRFAEGVPADLCRLTLQMLSMDRRLRPVSASEVMERLSGIVGRPHTDTGPESSAYLTTPTLIGREADLLRMRRVVIDAVRVRGRRVVISGERGVGRSRFLDACVLEGKLAGATVVRADAADAASGDYGTIKTLIGQLLGTGADAAEALAPFTDVLSPLLPDATQREPVAGGAGLFESEAAQTEDMVSLRNGVCAWIRALCKARCVVIAVDDLHRADENSAALITALADEADTHRLLVVATVADEAGSGEAACRWFIRSSIPVMLERLSDDQIGQLVSSLFGAAAHVPEVSAAIIPRCNGRPKACLRLAQHLVAAGLARYRAGSWTLPSRLTERDLPATGDGVARAQLSGLSETARHLVELFAYCDGGLTLDSLLHLTAGVDRATFFNSLDGLLVARMIETGDQHYRLVDSELSALARHSCQPERRRQVHCALADMHRATGDSGRLEAIHRVAGADAEGAIEPMVRYIQYAPHWLHGTAAENARLLEPVIAAAKQHRYPDATLIPLEMRLLRIACSLQVPNYQVHIPPLVARLKRASGLDLLEAMDPALDVSERAQTALTAAIERFEREGGADKTEPPVEAIKSLASVQRIVTLLAAATANVGLFDMLPSLAGFVPLAPFLDATEWARQAGQLLARGRYEAALPYFDGILEALDDQGHAALSPVVFNLTRDNIRFFKGMVHARLGHSEAFALADQLETSPSFQVNAWILRLSAHLRLGDIVAAQACRRRVELLNVEQRPPQSLEAVATLAELDYHGVTRDVSGIQSTLAMADEMTQLHPTWEPWRTAAYATYDVLRGDAASGEEVLRKLIGDLDGVVHAAVPWVHGQHVLALCALEQFEEAVVCGTRYLASSEAADSVTTTLLLRLAVAVARARSGDGDGGRDECSQVISLLDELQVSGMIRTRGYQCAALIACARNDAATFDESAALFMSEAHHVSVHTIGVLHSEMIEAAHEAGFDLDARYLLQGTFDESKHQMAARTVAQAVALGDGSARSTRKQMLSLLMEWSDASEGALYVVEAGELQVACLSHLSIEQAEQAVPFVQRTIAGAAEVDGDDCDTISTMDTGEVTFGVTIDVAGTSFLCLMLRDQDGDLLAVAIVRSGEPMTPLTWELLQAVAGALEV